MRRAFPVFLLLLLACGPFFYQAPPSLGTYPERIAAKRWQHLLAESLPPAPPMPDAAALDEVCRKLPETLAPLDTPKRLAEIDRLLAENRNGPYAVGRANFLHELRELAADPVHFDTAKSYFEEDPTHPFPVGRYPWCLENGTYQPLPKLYDIRLKQGLDSFNVQIDKAPPNLQPHWKVRCGAFLFRIERYDDAAAFFTSVMDISPEHPRADAASLMLARSKIEKARKMGDNNDDYLMLRDEAATILKAFIARHPTGRFTPDAEGMLGVIARERGEFGTAIQHQLASLDLQPTPEITRNVFRECDRIFEELLESCGPEKPEEVWVDPEGVSLDPQGFFDAAAVARHPLVARLFVQHCIDPAAHISLPLFGDDYAYDGDRRTISFLNRRILKPKPFVRLALTKLGEELLKVKSKPDATTLTLLAWCATENGEHEQALALLDEIQAPVISDEAMQARAIVLQRLGRHAEALTAFDTLAKSHSDSPLTNDLPYRRLVSYVGTHQPGKAILDVLPLVFPSAKQQPDASPNLHPDAQLMQWLDTLIQFAPLHELESVYSTIESTHIEQRDLLRNIIRTRALAAHRFDLAARHLPESPKFSEDSPEQNEFDIYAHIPMTRAGWKKQVAPLAKLYAKLDEASWPDDQAKIHLAIARHWMKHRGSLTMPSLVLCSYAGSEDEKQDLLRRRNALELGWSRDTIHQELDHRDEATHALDHALLASASDDPAIGAPALELANDCLFRRAELSLYQKSRAMEAGDSKLSSDLSRQLCERFPKSKEAKRLVYYTFFPAAGKWRPGDCDFGGGDLRLEKYARTALESFHETDDPDLSRGRGLVSAGKYPQALALLESILSDSHQSYLHVVAESDFAGIALRLPDPKHRASIASAFRHTPGALDRLRLLVNGDTFLSQLKPLIPWLEEGH